MTIVLPARPKYDLTSPLAVYVQVRLTRDGPSTPMSNRAADAPPPWELASSAAASGAAAAAAAAAAEEDAELDCIVCMAARKGALLQVRVRIRHAQHFRHGLFRPGVERRWGMHDENWKGTKVWLRDVARGVDLWGFFSRAATRTRATSARWRCGATTTRARAPCAACV